jgi:hypothetical protein
VKDFITNVTFGFLMAQLFPGAIAVFAIAFTYFSIGERHPEGILATARYVLQVWGDASLGHQFFLLGLCIGAGMFIHGLHWASLGALEKRFQSVFDSYWNDRRLLWQVLLGPIKAFREIVELFWQTKNIRDASLQENVTNIHKDYMPHFEFVQGFYLSSAQFFAHTTYSLGVVMAAIATYIDAYGPNVNRVGLLALTYVLAGLFFVLGRIQLRTLFWAETELANRSLWAKIAEESKGGS